MYSDMHIRIHNNFSNVRELKSRKIAWPNQTLVEDQIEMERATGINSRSIASPKKPYLLSVLGMPGLCSTAQVESTFSTLLHDTTLSSSLFDPNLPLLHEALLNKPEWNLLLRLLIPHDEMEKMVPDDKLLSRTKWVEEEEEKEEEDIHPDAGRLIHLHCNSRRKEGDTTFPAAILNKQTNKTVAPISQPPAEAKPLVGVSIVSAFQIINCRLGSSWMIHSTGRWFVHEGRLDEYIIWFALHGWISATHPQIDASPLIIWWMTLNPKPGRSSIRSFNSSFGRRLLCLLRSRRWRLIEFCFAEEDLLRKGPLLFLVVEGFCKPTENSVNGFFCYVCVAGAVSAAKQFSVRRCYCATCSSSPKRSRGKWRCYFSSSS